LNNQVKRALFSVDSLNNIEQFAIAFQGMGWHIIATAETVKKLQQHDIVVEDVATFTGVTENYGFPPTLHPKIETALTLDVSFRIDLVYDIPYPLSKGNDIGGRTLLALGAKGNRIVVFTFDDMRQVIEELRQDPNNTNISDNYRMQLIDKAHAHIARHYMSLGYRQGEGLCSGLIGTLALRLMNGENPYQIPSDLFISEGQDSLSLHQLQPQNSNTSCFTNLADTDCILYTLCLAAEAFRLKYKRVPYIAIAAKHGNPCGMAIDWTSTEETVFGALWGNPMAIWGGEFITNFKIDGNLGRLLYKSEEREKLFGNAHWMLDVVVAPDFDKNALDILGRSSSRKIFKNSMLYEPKLLDFNWHYRQVRGGFLRQPSPNYILDITRVEYDNSQLNGKLLDSLIIAWGIVYSSNHGGNEVALVKDRRLLGVGGGPSTVDAAKTAVLRAQASGHDTMKSVFAADAFFPFTDAPEILKEAGCCSGIVPSGGKNETLVRKYFQSNDINIMYIPAQYRGFCRH